MASSNSRLQRVHWRRRVSLLVIAIALMGLLLGEHAATAAQPRASTPSLSAADMQQMIFVWASGTPAVQDLAQHHCAQLRLTTRQCAAISTAVRGAWRDLMRRDPAAVGRVGVAPQPAARAAVLATLATQLSAVTTGHVASLLAITRTLAAQMRDPRWLQSAAVIGRPIIGNPTTPAQNTVLVWATAYLQTALPAGMDPTTSPYVALPDNYLKYANLGNAAGIPAIYQPYYAPSGATTHWSVTVSTPDERHVSANALITDVGPWNEDDNWWDANGTSTTLPASCPITATPGAGATNNPLVDGICPNGRNLRRLYYYLLYQHGGLPFFQGPSYAPSGAFHTGTAWPTALPSFCAETVAASINGDGVTCGGATSYNGNNGAWLREANYDTPILNQASIDLSPAVDAALGWIYPSSGLVRVNVTGLP